MNMNRSIDPGSPGFLSRRRFVQGIAGVVAALGWDSMTALSESAKRTPAELSGRPFELMLDKLPVNFTGRRSVATGVNGLSPGPTFRWREGELITLAMTNRLKVLSSIHWHGVRIPTTINGVPGLSYRGIAPDGTYT